MRRVPTFVMPTCLLLLTTIDCCASIVIDQEHSAPVPAAAFDSFANFNPSEWRQEVTTGVEGKLSAIDILPLDDSLPIDEAFDFFVNVGAGFQNDAHDFATNVISTTDNPNAGDRNWFSIDVSSANIILAAGDVFSFGMSTNTFRPNFHVRIAGFPGTGLDLYPQGGVYLNGFDQSGSFDFFFRTHVDTSFQVAASQPAIPEPTMLLVWAGLACCGTLAAKRRR